jgi:hypothetical protein
MNSYRIKQLAARLREGAGEKRPQGDVPLREPLDESGRYRRIVMTVPIADHVSDEKLEALMDAAAKAFPDWTVERKAAGGRSWTTGFDESGRYRRIVMTVPIADHVSDEKLEALMDEAAKAFPDWTVERR